jgi:hypothetical protein
MAAQASCGSGPAGQVDQLRGEGQRDDQRGADVVERRRCVAQQPARAGQGVRRAQAGQRRGQTHPVEPRGDGALEGDRPAQAHPGEPVRQRDSGQLDQDGAAGDSVAE